MPHPCHNVHTTIVDRGSPAVGKRAQVAVGSFPSALLRRTDVAHRADDVPNQARGRRVPGLGAYRRRPRLMDRSRGREDPAGGVRRALDGRSGLNYGRALVSCTKGNCGCTSCRCSAQSTSVRSARATCGPGAPTCSRQADPACRRWRSATGLLHAIFATAVEDGLVPRNPCVLKGASAERPAERPVATIEQVFELADAIEPNLRAMVLLATFCGLRLGELRALRRRHLDLLHRTVKVVEQYQELADGTLVLGPPKTDAGVRTVAVPSVIIPDLEAHLASGRRPAATASCSRARPAGRCDGRRSTRRGVGRARSRRCRRACGSTTFATPETRSPPPPARARRSSCHAWATRRNGRH